MEIGVNNGCLHHTPILSLTDLNTVAGSPGEFEKIGPVAMTLDKGRECSASKVKLLPPSLFLSTQASKKALRLNRSQLIFRQK